MRPFAQSSSTCIEAGDVTVVATVSPSNRYVIAAPGSATVTIADDD